MSIYSSRNYAMGASQISMGAADTGMITSAEKARAEIEIKKMRGELTKWLKYRALLGTPASDITPVEQRLGKRLHVLLSEMFDAQQLPGSDKPIELAKIAIVGKLSSEVTAPSAQGAVWMWPAVAVVGLVLMTVVVKIKSDAADAADARHTECVAAGKCVDTGFWLKAAGMTFLAWFAWEKLGLKKMGR
jgi:hypothetical protein